VPGPEFKPHTEKNSFFSGIQPWVYDVKGMLKSLLLMYLGGKGKNRFLSHRCPFLGMANQVASGSLHQK
jgi:hypothetical protein